MAPVCVLKHRFILTIMFQRGGSAQQRLHVQETESPLHLAT